jgi:peptidoglycan/xylan/chitin deacetylase (PgdA/CDA1 family)
MPRGIDILMYHQVGRFAPMREHRSTYCRVERFAAQMAYLARFGYRVLTMEEVLACVLGSQPTPARAVALTFDDGYESFFEHAWPVLQRHNFPAIVYVITGLIGRRAEWFATDGREMPALMSASRIRQLRREGVQFGSHGESHLRLAGQEPQRVRRELEGSKARLEDILGEPVSHFCYPYGSHDLQAVAAAAQAGYASATTCVRARASGSDDALCLPRKAVSYGDTLPGVIWKLHFKNVPKETRLQRPGLVSTPSQR